MRSKTIIGVLNKKDIKLANYITVDVRLYGVIDAVTDYVLVSDKMFQDIITK